MLLMPLQSIAEKLRAEYDQQRASSFGRRDSSSSVQSLTSAEVEEITRTARNANQRIEELARSATTSAPTTPDGTAVVKTFLNIPTGLFQLHALAVLWSAVMSLYECVRVCVIKYARIARKLKFSPVVLLSARWVENCITYPYGHHVTSQSKMTPQIPNILRIADRRNLELKLYTVCLSQR